MLVFWDHSCFLTCPKDTARQVSTLPVDKTEAQRNGTRSGGLPHSHPHKRCLPPSHLSPDLRQVSAPAHHPCRRGSCSHPHVPTAWQKGTAPLTCVVSEWLRGRSGDRRTPHCPEGPFPRVPHRIQRTNGSPRPNDSTGLPGFLQQQALNTQRSPTGVTSTPGKPSKLGFLNYFQL